MDMKTHEGLLAALDAARGQDPWNGGPRLTLRAIFVYKGAYNHEEPRWRWYAGCTLSKLHCERAGAWDANLMDHLLACEWEISRREAGVSEATVEGWLGLQQ
ncbi:MAG: hypothetical protein ACRCSL_16615 [Microbacterium sp.]